MTSPLAQTLTLPCGAVLPNRIAKAAMSEGLADADNQSTPRLTALYGRWSRSGAGLILSGNIQVDRWHLERPGNVELEDESGLAALSAMAAAARAGGAHVWAQLGHTGRQVQAPINAAPLAPSVVEIEMMRGAGFDFAKPVAMREEQIEEAIRKFAVSARLARQAGFTGVELHGAHGYLISQFLSARTNLRTDRWGGSLENRARFLLEALDAVRVAVGADFPIALKLNASDFLKGGFTHEECLTVVGWLNGSTLDLLELSGGSLEQPKQVGVALKEEGVDGTRESTVKREAYFIAMAGAVKAIAVMPVMVTGGFRTRAAMEAALSAGELDVVGLGRPFIVDPEIGTKLLDGAVEAAPEAGVGLFHLLPWHNMQLERMGDGLAPDLNMSGETAAAEFGPREDGLTARLMARRAEERRHCA